MINKIIKWIAMQCIHICSTQRCDDTIKKYIEIEVMPAMSCFHDKCSRSSGQVDGAGEQMVIGNNVGDSEVVCLEIYITD